MYFRRNVTKYEIQKVHLSVWRPPGGMALLQNPTSVVGENVYATNDQIPGVVKRILAKHSVRTFFYWL